MKKNFVCLINLILEWLYWKMDVGYRYTSICLTKLDILDTLAEIKICTQYKLNGKEIDYFPSNATELAQVETVYETVQGWQTSTEGIRCLDNLPPNAQKYVRLIEKYLEVPSMLYMFSINSFFLNTFYFIFY